MLLVPRRRLHLTALTILIAVLLLLVFISVSTYSNLGRERDAAMETARRQALTLIQALEAGARAGMQTQAGGEEAIGHLVHEIGRSGDIHYLYLANTDGEVVHHSIPSLEGTRALWRPQFKHGVDIETRLRTLADGTRVYEVAKPFSPMGNHSKRAATAVKSGAEGSLVHFHDRDTIYLGMTMAAYDTARRSDFQHAVVMCAIVLALGGGVIYFYVVIRSYYLLSRTLQKTQDYTRQVIASMVHGVLSIDAEGRVASSNHQAGVLLGISEPELERLDLGTVFDFESTGIALTLQQGNPVLNREIAFHRPGGDLLPLQLTVTPIQDEAGRHGGAVVVLRDLSALKRLEDRVKRAEKLAAIGRLAASVAHEIRNPLSSIRGFAYLLGKNQPVTAPEREYADVMVREIDRINRVVTDLLNFARPRELELARTKVPELVRHVVALVSADADDQGIDIAVYDDDALPPLMLDPNQVTQALLNLLLNSLHAMASGGQIRIHARAMSDDSGVTIHVEDDGPGIPPELIEKVFEPFYTTREHGTGLGLALVRKIAETHDGCAMAVSPPPGKARGTRLSLILRDMATATDAAVLPDGGPGEVGAHSGHSAFSITPLGRTAPRTVTSDDAKNSHRR